MPDRGNLSESPACRPLFAVVLAASVLAVASSVSSACRGGRAGGGPGAGLRTTEFTYQLRDFVTEHEFVELTNVGTTPVNMTGWSFDDVDAIPGQFSL